MATKMNAFSKLKKQALVMLCISAISTTCFADRIKDFADIAGQRSNQLVGYGLVVGLDGTGDQTTQTPFTLQSVLQMIGVLGVTIPQGVKPSCVIRLQSWSPLIFQPWHAQVSKSM
jgi:flagellar P-ring protein FlgI